MSEQHPPPGNGGAVQVREVYALVQSVKAEIMAELRAIDARWEQRLTMHETDHEREVSRRSQLTRWAVTSVLTGAGVLVAITLGVINVLR